MRLWIRTPYPGEKPGEGPWTECVTPWMRRLHKIYAKNGKLPVAKSEDQPDE